MKKHILALGLISAITVACTLSVSDKNPKGISLFGGGGSGVVGRGSIANGSLTLSGNNLNYVTSVELTQSGAPNVPLALTSQTANMITMALPSALKLPGILLVSSSAGAAEFNLTALDSLTVDGAMNVAGTTDLGIEKVQTNCVTGTAFCSVSCPTGKKIITGGCFAYTATVGLSANYPSGDNSWTCRPAASSQVDAFAICGRVNLTY